MGDEEQGLQQLEELAESAKSVPMAILATNLAFVRRDLTEVKRQMTKDMAPKSYVDAKFSEIERRLGQLEKVVYGAAAFILLAVLGAIMVTIGLKK